MAFDEAGLTLSEMREQYTQALATINSLRQQLDESTARNVLLASERDEARRSLETFMDAHEHMRGLCIEHEATVKELRAEVDRLTDIPEEHRHLTATGPTEPAQYRHLDNRHAHDTPAGLSSWEYDTPEHTHLIDTEDGVGDKTGPPLERT